MRFDKKSGCLFVRRCFHPLSHVASAAYVGRWLAGHTRRVLRIFRELFAVAWHYMKRLRTSLRSEGWISVTRERWRMGQLIPRHFCGWIIFAARASGRPPPRHC
jgi:hypothetical protein